MSSVIIAGDTSGTVTLQAPAAAGSTVITLPTVTGGSFIVSDSSGNVGIGTSSPAVQLQQYLASGTTYRQITNGTVNITEYASTTVAACSYGTTSSHPLLFTTNNTERMRLDTSGNLLFNSGYGSVATAYGCRAWVNFNGTGTPAIRVSGNVSSITDNGTGDYTVNFTTAMPDANYSAVAMVGGVVNSVVSFSSSPSITTSAFKIATFNSSTAASSDPSQVHVAVFR
jgi:hypothetical protein